jgi:hypothetical protein
MSMYYLLKFQGHFLGLAMAQVPWRARFDPRSVRVRFVVDKLALGQAFVRVFRVSSVSIIPPLLHTHLNLHVTFTRANGRCLRTFQKAMLFRKSRGTG